MREEQNKLLMRRFFKAFQVGDRATLAELLAPEFAAHLPGQSEPMDRETFLQQVIGGFSAAFSDQQYTIHVQIAEGDRVATLATWQGVHTGDFHGHPPTGNEIALSGIAIDLIEGNKIVEHWPRHDQLDFMQQLGLMPEPEQAS
ncbi:MAG: ester cyclase [Candidatus Promineifilaceae bacterium]|nr:ester cyclase [Candidatus Promineifilaceae bacterium]